MRSFRVFNILKKLGVDEEALESFVANTYTRCIGSGLDPGQIGSYLSDIVSFWSLGEGNSLKIDEKRDGQRAKDIIPNFSEIPVYLPRLKADRTKLESEIRE